jgi:hypothetical protein
VANFLRNLTDKTNSVKNVKSVVKLLLTESFCGMFVWDQATLDCFDWGDGVQVLPPELVQYLVEERHRQAALVNGFNHQVWMRTLRKIFTTACKTSPSTVSTLNNYM